MLDDLTKFWRFARGLRGFLRSPLSPHDCRRIVEERLRGRERTFLLLLRKAVFGNPASPYLPLLRWAGVEYGDIEQMVGQDGIEAALARLYGAGVHIGIEEAKGRRPIQRRGLHVEVKAEDLDNPLLSGEIEVTGGGSTGPRRRLSIDFDQIAIDSACRYLVHAASGFESMPVALWRAVPPGGAGIRNVLELAKFRHPAERWFTPFASSWSPNMMKSALFTSYLVLGGRMWGGLIPRPEFVPLGDPLPVAEYLAGRVRQGTPAMLVAPANSAVRVCIVAKDRGLDIAGTVFRVSGEPFTEAKSRLVSELGARTFSSWAMSEAGGPLAGGCPNREAVDDVHVYRHKIAILQIPKALDDGETTVDALYLTTLCTTSTKVLLNLESGDYAALNQRRCGCLLEAGGFTEHLHTIRSYEKLTTGGMHFMGGNIATLVEEVLPARHGGHPTDYQLVEEEEGAVSRVMIVVSPRLGDVNHDSIAKTVIEFLGSRSRGDRMMASHWAQGRTLTVVRREPYSTVHGKIPPLRTRIGQNRRVAPPGGRSGD
jgi:hypothetical protein